MSIGKSLGRLFFLASYPLYFKRKLNRTSVTTLFGFDLTIPPSVFHPRFFFSTKILGRFVEQLPLSGKGVLEIGSGAGIISLIAARNGANVVSVDINPMAVRSTRNNAKKNNLSDKVIALESDLFHDVGKDSRFDYIIWNPPFFPEEPHNDTERAWKAGRGYRVLSTFAEQAASFLRPEGKLIIILSSQCNLDEILHNFTRCGFQYATVRRQRSFFEYFVIYQMTLHRSTD